jgi:hypothetical protein
VSHYVRQGSGLTIAQIEGAATNILAYVKANAGADFAKQATTSIPGFGGKHS